MQCGIFILVSPFDTRQMHCSPALHLPLSVFTLWDRLTLRQAFWYPPVIKSVVSGLHHHLGHDLAAESSSLAWSSPLA